MLMTSVLLFIAMREIWGWSLLAAGAVAALFLVVDGGFFAANMAKVLEGGWVPLLLACAVYGVMWIWHRGVIAVHDTHHRRAGAARRRFVERADGRQDRPRAGLGGVPHPRQGRDAAGHGLARAARTARCTSTCWR